MPYWVQIIDVFWPLLVALTVILAAVATLWLRSQFVPSATAKEIRADLDALNTKLETISVQIEQIQHDADDDPSRMKLLEGLNALGARMSRMEASWEGMQRTNGAQNHAIEQRLANIDRYLNLIIETGLQR